MDEHYIYERFLAEKGINLQIFLLTNGVYGLLKEFEKWVDQHYENRIQFELPQELYNRLKENCKETGQDINDLAANIIHGYLIDPNTWKNLS